MSFFAIDSTTGTNNLNELIAFFFFGEDRLPIHVKPQTHNNSTAVSIISSHGVHTLRGMRYRIVS